MWLLFEFYLSTDIDNIIMWLLFEFYLSTDIDNITPRP